MKKAFAAYPFGVGEMVGLKAIKREHHALVQCRNPANTRFIVASVDADFTLKGSQPRATRWDYVIAYGKRPMRLICAEVHPAKPDQVNVVIAKMEWLESMMKEFSLPPRVYVWLPTKRNAISPLSSEARRLAKRGIVIRRPVFLDET